MVREPEEHKPLQRFLGISFPPDVAFGGGVPWDGFLIMDWLRRIDEAKGIPTIIITGADPTQYLERAKAAGVVGFFQKPLDLDQLLATIRQTLGEDVAASQS